MQFQFDPADLRPLVEEVVGQLVDRLVQDNRIALGERDAAAAIGVTWNCLRDCRLRGEIHAARVGKSYSYLKSDLVRFLQDRKAAADPVSLRRGA